MGYPSTVFAPATRTNGQTIDASHVNDLQTEVAAIESGLLNGFAHDLKPTANATYDLGISGTAWRDLFITRNGTIGNTLGVTGAVTAAGFIPSSSAVPTNGLYLPSANALGIATNGTLRATIASNGILTYESSIIAGHTSGGFSMTTWPTTGSAANAFIADGDLIYRSTSTKRAKQDIEPLTLAQALPVVMGLHPVTYRGIQLVDRDRRFPGFIAEDVAPLEPLLATYDPDGSPNYVTYDRIPAYLVPVVQDLVARMTALEAA